MFTFSIIQKMNKRYWFFIKNSIYYLDYIKKDKIRKRIRINFLDKLIKRRKPIFTKKLKYILKKQKLSYRKLIQSNNKYYLFFNKKSK